MTGISIVLDAEGAWKDLPEKLRDGSAQWLKAGTDGSKLTIGVLPAGMQSGKPSITVRVDTPDGKVVCIETSWRALRTACDAISARYGAGGD